MASQSREHRAPVRYGLKPDEIRELATSLQARNNAITDIDIRGLSKRFGCAAKTIHEIAERLGCTITSVEASGAPEAPANGSHRPNLALSASDRTPPQPSSAAPAPQPPLEARRVPALDRPVPRPVLTSPSRAPQPHRLTYSMVDDWSLTLSDPRDSLKLEARGSSVLEDPRDPVRKATPDQAKTSAPAPGRTPRASSRASHSDNSQIASALGDLRSRMPDQGSISLAVSRAGRRPPGPRRREAPS